MTRTIHNTNFWTSLQRNVVQSTAINLLVSALALVAMAQTSATSSPTGVRNSRGARALNASQLQMIQQTLRQKTGVTELSFDAQGRLTLGQRNQVAGSSATAHALLLAAVEGENLYELENHEDAPNVAFAQLNEAADEVDEKTGKRLTIFQVQLDFADFDRLGGPREAKASFDIGLALLHELVHGVLRLQDPQGGTMGEIGECDAHVNQMRRELCLPERLYYHPNINVVQIMARRIVVASLEFADNNKQYRLSWRTDHVAPAARNIAQLQQGLLVAKNR